MAADLGPKIFSFECFPMLAPYQGNGIYGAIRVEFIHAREILESLIDVVDDEIMGRPQMTLGNSIAGELMETCRQQPIQNLQQVCGADHQMRELRRTAYGQIYAALNWKLYITLREVLKPYSV